VDKPGVPCVLFGPRLTRQILLSERFCPHRSLESLPNERVVEHEPLAVLLGKEAVRAKEARKVLVEEEEGALVVRVAHEQLLLDGALAGQVEVRRVAPDEPVEVGCGREGHRQERVHPAQPLQVGERHRLHLPQALE